MKKPEILIDKVSEFIEETSSCWGDFPAIRLIKDFYSQPFKPEMITEYFDVRARMPEINEYEDLDGLAFRFLSEDFIIYNDSVMRFPIAKTLSQFITNCIQAGIKLTWKE